MEVTKDDGGKYLEQLIDDIQAGVLLGELLNEYEAIRVFVYRRLYEMKKDSNNNLFVEKEHKKIEVIEKQNIEAENDEEYQEDVYEEKNIEISKPKTIEDALFEERIRQINLDALEDKLNRQIDELIKKSNVLDEMKGHEAIDTYNRMKKKYREALIDKYPEYSKLKDRYHE